MARFGSRKSPEELTIPCEESLSPEMSLAEGARIAFGSMSPAELFPHFDPSLPRQEWEGPACREARAVSLLVAKKQGIGLQTAPQIIELAMALGMMDSAVKACQSGGLDPTSAKIVSCLPLSSSAVVGAREELFQHLEGLSASGETIPENLARLAWLFGGRETSGDEVVDRSYVHPSVPNASDHTHQKMKAYEQTHPDLEKALRSVIGGERARASTEHHYGRFALGVGLTAASLVYAQPAEASTTRAVDPQPPTTEVRGLGFDVDGKPVVFKVAQSPATVAIPTMDGWALPLQSTVATRLADSATVKPAEIIKEVTSETFAAGKDPVEVMGGETVAEVEQKSGTGHKEPLAVSNYKLSEAIAIEKEAFKESNTSPSAVKAAQLITEGLKDPVTLISWYEDDSKSDKNFFMHGDLGVDSRLIDEELKNLIKKYSTDEYAYQEEHKNWYGLSTRQSAVLMRLVAIGKISSLSPDEVKEMLKKLPKTENKPPKDKETEKPKDPETGKKTKSQLVKESILKVYNQPTIPEELKDYIPFYIKYGEKYNIDPYLLAGQEFTESTFNPDAVGVQTHIGKALGLGQLMPITIEDIKQRAGADLPENFDPTNPEHAIWAHAWLLNDYRAQLSRAGLTSDPDTLMELTIASYYCGVGCVKNAGGMPQSADIRGYVRKVMGEFTKLHRMEDTLTEGSSRSDDREALPGAEYNAKQRKKFINRAIDELGTKENPVRCDAGNPSAKGSCGPIDKYTQGYLEYWCANFVSYVAEEVGMPFTGDSDNWRINAVRNIKASKYVKVFDKNAYTPRPGDLVTFGSDGNQHIAIVESYNAQNKTITYIGGNQRGPGSSNGDSVTRVTVAVSDSFVRQFINIDELIEHSKPKKSSEVEAISVEKVESKKYSTSNMKNAQATGDMTSVVETELKNAKNGNLKPQYLREIGDKWVVQGVKLKLHPKAAAAFVEMNDAYFADTGRNLAFQGPRSAYRTLQEQIDIKKERGNFAAKEGTSPHGLGRAVDLSDSNNVSDPTYIWLMKNAHRFGFVKPAWAAPNGSLPEAWHWEFMG